MPEDLNASYERTLFHLCWFDPSTAVSNQLLVYSILIFVAISGRPVTIAEAAEFAIIEDKGEEIQVDDRFEDPTSILSLAGTLVCVQDSVLSLAHRSVKEFLKSPRAQWGSLRMGEFLGMSGQLDDIEVFADTFIAQRCLSYLARPHLSARQVMATRVVKDPNITYLGRLQKANPLLDYAARMWPYHLKELTVQKHLQDGIHRALHLTVKEGLPSLWKGWIFLQRADIWEQQVWLASFLCECFIRASLVHEWVRDFWHGRRAYRITSDSTSESGVDEPYDIGFPLETVGNTILGPLNCQCLDLALLLLEIGFQKPLYRQKWGLLQQIGKQYGIKDYITELRLKTKDIIPRMGGKYYEAIDECLKLVVHPNAEGPSGKDIFQIQRQDDMVQKILRPLLSLASSGFYRSRGFSTYKIRNVRNLHVMAEGQQISIRPSSTPFGPNYHQHKPAKAVSKPEKRGQDFVFCAKCNRFFPSHEALISHNVRNGDFCHWCQVCLSSKSLVEHDRIRHPAGDLRWSSL